MKKINCKHGLERKQEIQARRLKEKICAGNYEEVCDKLKELYNEYKKQISGSFYNYLKEKDVVIYSAFERAGGIMKFYEVMNKIIKK